MFNGKSSITFTFKDESYNLASWNIQGMAELDP